MVGKIATGEITENEAEPDDGKDKAAVAIGRKGDAAQGGEPEQEASG